MQCLSPIHGFQGKDGKVRQGTRNTMPGKAMTVACGRCAGCRLERARQWSVRIMHEAAMHPRNSFITLTYDPKHLPADKGLDVTHFQKFMKRLRNDLAPRPIRFYHCGEYGADQVDELGNFKDIGRAHYHAAIFNWDFPDKTPWKDREGNMTYKSEQLEKLWTKGLSEIGSLTAQSAGYVARYIMKKVNGKRQDNYYLDIATGVVRNPPYTTMSTRPGIGRSWIEQYMTDTYPSDEVISNGQAARPPRYYDAQYEKHNPQGYLDMKFKRETEGKKHKADNTPRRLADKTEYLQSRTKTLIRGL